jgi:hypothetical protein
MQIIASQNIYINEIAQLDTEKDKTHTAFQHPSKI